MIEPSEVQVSPHSLGACHGFNIQTLIILMMSPRTALCIKTPSFLILNHAFQHFFFYFFNLIFFKSLNDHSAIHNVFWTIFIISPFDLHIMLMAGLSSDPSATALKRPQHAPTKRYLFIYFPTLFIIAGDKNGVSTWNEGGERGSHGHVFIYTIMRSAQSFQSKRRATLIQLDPSESLFSALVRPLKPETLEWNQLMVQNCVLLS